MMNNGKYYVRNLVSVAWDIRSDGSFARAPTSRNKLIFCGTWTYTRMVGLITGRNPRMLSLRQKRVRDIRIDALLDCGEQHLLQGLYIPIKSKFGKRLLGAIQNKTIQMLRV